jgi:hypothetical protein
MEFSKIVRKSSAHYRMNLVLFVPPFVALIMSIAASGILPGVGMGALPTFTPSLLMMGFGVIFLNLVVSFLVILGQASMSGNVVSEGKTKLADWGSGVRKYFFRVLGIGLVFLGIMFVLFMIVGIAIALTILPKLITPEGTVAPPTTPTTLTAQPMFSLAMTILFTVAQSIFYVWLAPAILDDKGVGTSLDMGVKAVRKTGRAFVGFIAFFFIVSAIATLIGDLPAIIGINVQPLVGSLTSTRIVSQIIERIFSPLWFLIAFELYHETNA